MLVDHTGLEHRMQRLGKIAEECRLTGRQLQEAKVRHSEAGVV